VSSIQDQTASALSITDTKEEAFYLMTPSVAMIIQCWCKTDKISIWSTGGIIEGTVRLMTCHKGTQGELRYRSTHSVSSVADGDAWWNNDRGKLWYLGGGTYHFVHHKSHMD
jgi:hypothetical protein